MRNTSYAILLIIGTLMVWQSVSAQSNVFYNQIFYLSAPSEDTCYYYPAEYVYNSAGSTVVGIISVNPGKVDFYILDSAEKQTLNGSHKGGCNNLLPQRFEFRATGITFDTFTYYVPDGGNHYFVFFNPFPTDATISLVLSWGGSPTTTSSYIYTPTYTPYQSTTNLGTVQTGFNPYPLLEVGLIGAVIVVVLIAFQTMRKKAPTNQTAPKILEKSSVTKPSPVIPSKLFCLECGNELPFGSKFCNKCGTKQP